MVRPFLLPLWLLVASRAGAFAPPRVAAPSRVTTAPGLQKQSESERRPSHLHQAVKGNLQDDEVLDVLVCGAGPGGLLLCSALAQQGLKVGVVDPALDQPWPNNYGVWMDEAEYFGYDDCVNAVWKQAGVIFDEDTPEVILKRPYGRVDRIQLKARLLQELDTFSSGQYFSACAKAMEVEHFDNEPSVVTIRQKAADDSEAATTTQQIKAMLVVDATGFSRDFVKHDCKFDPGYQVTYGALFRVKDLGPYQLDRMVLMDYCERHLHDDPELVASNDRFPSFVYAMPLAPDLLFLEETILVSRPGGSSRNLQARLYKRMEALGIEPIEVLEDERAAIPMGGMDPIVPQRTLGFGATASLVHPASGYMVARAMEIAPRVAQAVAPKLLDLKQQQQSSKLTDGALDAVAAAGWNAVWPTDERRQRDFMHFGFELLCQLTPQELRDFFTGFFRLPRGLWEHFLSWRLSGVGHVVMGLTVWATCIPKRFMVPMVWKSLPFLPNRLVLPFFSRGNNAEIDTESVYFDARTDDYQQWEPENFYPYLQSLTDRTDYQSPADVAKSSARSNEKDQKTTASSAATTATSPEPQRIASLD